MGTLMPCLRDILMWKLLNYSRMNIRFGINSTELTRLTPLLQDRVQFMKRWVPSSTPNSVICVIRQDSVLRLILFIPHTSDVQHLIKQHDPHLYTDDPHIHESGALGAVSYLAEWGLDEFQSTLANRRLNASLLVPLVSPQSPGYRHLHSFWFGQTSMFSKWLGSLHADVNAGKSTAVSPL